MALMSSSLAKHFGADGITSNILIVGTINNLADYESSAATFEASKQLESPSRPELPPGTPM